ncbi:hypothetical protein [Diaphorobacter sp.]|uniref:hypothetical protein n=1 Tax=Diaphorobacter sp. TaxID=1934310 RepID=UPI003D0CD271
MALARLHPPPPGHPPCPLGPHPQASRLHLLAPELHAAARRAAAHVHALQVRIHTFYLKFLQGHT